MRFQGIAIAQYTFRSILSACGALSALEQNGCSEEAVRVFAEMQRDGIDPDDYTLGSVISSCANLYCAHR